MPSSSTLGWCWCGSPLPSLTLGMVVVGSVSGGLGQRDVVVNTASVAPLSSPLGWWRLASSVVV